LLRPTATENNVSQQSEPCVFAKIKKPQTMNQSSEQQQHQHTTLHELIQSTTAPEPLIPTSYATHSKIIEHEPQQQVHRDQAPHQHIIYVRNECDVTLEEQEYQSHMQNSPNNTVNHIVEDDMVEDLDQDEVRIRIVYNVFIM
jgi:hypothetical protein